MLKLQERSLRLLGIAESFRKGMSEKSVLIGVVMTADMAIKGIVVAKATVGGMDATEKIITMLKEFNRCDITLLMLNGCIISWYNVIDLIRVAEETSLPLICVTYDTSEGLEKYFKELFPQDWKIRVDVYRKNKSRIPIKLDTGYTIYIRFIGMNLKTARRILNKFTWHGSIPEPLRVARIIARAMVKFL